MESVKIVNNLISDNNLCQRWRQFSHALGVEGPELVQWEFGLNQGTLKFYDVFHNIYDSWKSANGSKATINSLCKILRDMHIVSVAEKLEALFKISSSQIDWPLNFNIGKVNTHFVGRKKPLNELHGVWNYSTHKIILISGLGGIGKTELIRKFTHDLYEKGNISCTWFDAETEGSLNQCFVKLKKEIDAGTKQDMGRLQTTTEFYADVFKFIEREHKEKSTRWLAIFDNVDDLHNDLRTCLKMLSETLNTMTILTSRNRLIRKNDWKTILLEEWEAEDAEAYVRNYFIASEFETDEHEITELCAKLQNYALAMQQALAYIVKQKFDSIKGLSYSIRDYISEYDANTEKKIELLDYQLDETSGKFADTTFSTWNTTIGKIKNTSGEVGKLACSILDRIAFLDPNGISLAYVKNTTKIGECANRSCNEEMIREAVELLKAYSLVNIENCVISIHRMVQEVTRLKLTNPIGHPSLLEHLILEVMHITFISDLPHVQSVWEHCLKDPHLIRKFPNMADLIFQKLLEFGLVTELHKFANDNHIKLANIFGVNHEATLNMLSNVARSLRAKGECCKSIDLYSKVLKLQKTFLGKNHESTLTTGHNMAAVYTDLKNFEKAKKKYKKVLNLRKNILGPNHSSTIDTKHNLAVLLQKQGDINKALRKFYDVLKLEKGQLGCQHLYTLNTKHNIAACLFQLGKYKEAQTMFEYVLKGQENLFGVDHPSTISSKYWLGVVSSKISYDQEKSLAILREVRELQVKVLGAEHPWTVSTERWVNKLVERNGSLIEKINIWFFKLKEMFWSRFNQGQENAQS